MTNSFDDDGIRPNLELLCTVFARYRLLLSELKKINDTGDNDFAKVQRALLEVLGFVNADQAAYNGGTSRSLHRLAIALHDIERGAIPQLFANMTLERANKKGRPASIAWAAPQGAIAAVLKFLIDAGETRRDASHYLADELDRRGIRTPQGKPLEAKGILNLYGEVGARRAPKLAQDTYWTWLQRLKAEDHPARSNVQSPKKFVADCVQAIVDEGFG